MFARKTSVVVIVAIALLAIKTVTLIILGAVSYIRHTTRDLEYVRTALAVDADQIVSNLTRPVSNSDRLGIENVVESMMLDPALKGVVIKTVDNRTVLCARERDGQGKVTEAKGEIQVEGPLVEKREVKFDDQTLATVTLFGTTKPVQDRTGGTLRWILINILWVDTVLFVGAYLLLNRWVFKPLREVEASAARSGSGEEVVPMHASQGEFESIRLSLEKMIGQLKAEIAERRRAEEVLREKQAQLFLAMDIARLASWEFDVEKDRFTGDEQMFQLLGTTPAQEGGHSLSPQEYIRKFVHPSDTSIVANELALAVSATDPNFARQFEHRFVRQDGTEGVMMVRSRIVMGSSGRPGKILGTNQDVTERKKLEQQFLRAQRMESLGVLAGGVAHDLNNSLAPILMAVSLMEMKFTDAQSKKLISTVDLSARRGVDMVQQLLSFARGVEGRRMELQVGHLVRDVEKLINDTFLKSVRVSTNVPVTTRTVVGDPTQIHQVLLNLCVNARDAMPNGGEINIVAENVTVDTPPVHVPDAKAGAYVRLKVSDTGTGIPPEIIEKIFDPFFTTKEVGK
ncbi:MAG: hypothetical protein DMF06_12490, partial [Verrucomicrobia bacterium]